MATEQMMEFQTRQGPAAGLEEQISEHDSREIHLEFTSGEVNGVTNANGQQLRSETQQPLVNSSSVQHNSDPPPQYSSTMPSFETVQVQQSPPEVREFSAKKFYCTRPGAFDHAVEDLKQYIEPSLDGRFKGAWLLTEIDHWDHEKERLVILTEFQLLVIKYDFVALRINDCRRVSLKTIEKVQSGRFVFPEKSLKASRPFQTGIRIHLDKSRVMTKWQRWSPFYNDVPFVTFHQHKVATLLDQLTPELIYEEFKQALIQALTDLGVTFEAALEPIELEIYVGMLSTLHNSSDLGFSKDRGAASF